jgi:hypothetical protein
MYHPNYIQEFGNMERIYFICMRTDTIYWRSINLDFRF